MRILIIEDEKKIAGFIRRGLREEGYAADEAHDGEAGFQTLSEHEYDLALLDLMLPRLDGLSLCRKIRDHWPRLPILMLTAKDAVSDKVAGLDAGADDYLTKPFAFEELLARIRAIFRKRNPVPAGTNLSLAGLEMDLLGHKVRRSGRELELTSREFALLEYLLRNAGQLVTRTMIAEHVWDVNFDTGTNVIDVYVNYLRNKVDRDFEKKLIHTVRGRGYLLKD